MFKLPKPLFEPPARRMPLSPQVAALVQRMRLASLQDQDLARLLDELAPHLPLDPLAVREI